MYSRKTLISLATSGHRLAFTPAAGYQSARGSSGWGGWEERFGDGKCAEGFTEKDFGCDGNLLGWSRNWLLLIQTCYGAGSTAAVLGSGLPRKTNVLNSDCVVVQNRKF